MPSDTKLDEMIEEAIVDAYGESESFVDDYSFGGFKGNEDAWMETYFDAYLYLAKRGTHVLKLRLPSRLLDAATAKTYCGGDSAFVREKDGKTILSFVSQDEEDGDWVEGEGHLSSMISVRAELLRGDLRALYLGWLLRAQTGELDDDDTEPSVPPGVGQRPTRCPDFAPKPSRSPST